MVFEPKNCQQMALKSIKRLILSIDGVSNKLASKVFRRHFNYEKCTFHQNFWCRVNVEDRRCPFIMLREKVEKTIPFLNLKKNDEKIFFNFRLFSGAGMINTQETLDKTISDVKKMLLTRYFITKQVNCCMVLKWLSDAILIIKNVFFSKTFDAELMLRTAAVHLSCCENNFSEIDFWPQKVEKTIPFLYLKKNDEKIFFNFKLFFDADMNNTREKPV
jgi:hypothetical protein